MDNKARHYLPEIDTTDFECALSKEQLMSFRRHRPEFIKLIHQIIIELNLQGQIEHLSICSPDRGRSELYRNKKNPWPSKNLCLNIYTEKYMDERLLRHELGHEADRRNPSMQYDASVEERWKGEHQWILEMAANISLDARLGDCGLGKQKRKEEFFQNLGIEHEDLFEEIWTSPPVKWLTIEKIAFKLFEISRLNQGD